MLWQGSLRGCICHILDESNTQKVQKPKNDIYTNVVILHKKVLNAIKNQKKENCLKAKALNMLWQGQEI